MANNSRASLVLINRPPIFFNEVKGAERYSFALVKKEIENIAAKDVAKNSSNSIWIKEICASALKSTSPDYTYTEDGHLFFEYPDGEADLENLATYIIIATAETNNETKTARGEFTVLEKDVFYAFQNIHEEVQKSSTQALIDKFNLFANKILSSSLSIKEEQVEAAGPGRWGILGCPPYLFLS